MQPKEKRREQFQKALSQPKVGLLILLAFLVTLAFAGLEATFALWSKRQFGWGPEQNGYIFAFVGLLGAAIQGGLISRLNDRFGEARLITQGAAALAIGMVLIPFCQSLHFLLFAMTISVYGFSIISPALSSLTSLQIDEEVQGGILGVTRSATTLGRVAGPAIAGVLFGWLGKDWPYFFGALIMTAVMIISIWIRFSENKMTKDD